MRYTAIAAILFGIVAACHAAFHFANGPLVFAAFLVIGGVLLWMVGGKGFTVSRGSAVRPRPGGPETFWATRTKPHRPSE
jgi:hypothetical protein